MGNKGKFHPGTRFRGNINGALMEVTKIEGEIVTLKDLRTGHVFTSGLRALETCDVTILEVAENG